MLAEMDEDVMKATQERRTGEVSSGRGHEWGAGAQLIIEEH
jgi:hypothetical protein